MGLAVSGPQRLRRSVILDVKPQVIHEMAGAVVATEAVPPDHVSIGRAASQKEVCRGAVERGAADALRQGMRRSHG